MHRDGYRKYSCDYRHSGTIQGGTCMRVIVVNSGSSSIKYETFELSGLAAAARGLLERVGTQDSRLKHRWLTPSGQWEEIVETRAVADHREGFSFILEMSSSSRAVDAAPKIFAVGHRVV